MKAAADTGAAGAGREERVRRARLSLEGLSVGDAFGQRFFYADVPALVAARALPPPLWRYTDDTAMSISIVDVLERCGEVNRDELAAAFARSFAAEPWRGYGPTAIDILESMVAGVPWREAAGRAFPPVRGVGVGGSMGNGGAMRVAPVGAYFAEDIEAAAANAAASAEVTHAHPEGQAGAVAVAVAAAQAWGMRGRGGEDADRTVIQAAIRHTPEGATREGLLRAADLPLDLRPDEAAATLGNGSRLVSQDTVPFALWCASRHLPPGRGVGAYEEAMWSTVSGLGDMDTNCAIVGGIVALSTGPEGIPETWRRAREPLP